MKLLSRTLLLVLALALVAPAVTLADELPREEKVYPGTVYLTYEGQNFRITTTSPVQVKFEKLSTFLIKIEIVAAEGTTTGKISVFWLNFEKQIYNGLVPLYEPWGAQLNTEGGFIDR